MVTAKRPYSVRKDLAGCGPKVNSFDNSGPAKISTLGLNDTIKNAKLH